MNQEESKKVFKRILEYYDAGEEVDTPYGKGEVYLDLGNYVQVAIHVSGDMFMGTVRIASDGVKMIATFPKEKIERLKPL